MKQKMGKEKGKKGRGKNTSTKKEKPEDNPRNK